jgi:hypothetical protein
MERSADRRRGPLKAGVAVARREEKAAPMLSGPRKLVVSLLRENVLGLHHTRSVGIAVAAIGFSVLPIEINPQGTKIWLTAVNLVC